MRRFILATLATAAFVQAQNRGPLTENAASRWNTLKMNLVESAEAMPEPAYSFKLTPAQRTFGEWIEHTVSSAYNYCSQMQGKPAPAMDHAAHHGTKSKADLVKAMKDAAAFCDTAFAGMTDQKALTEVSIGERKVYPVSGMLSVLAGLNSHYGNMVGYMRTKGIVPPSTARAQKAQPPKK